MPRARAGSTALTMLSVPLNAHVLDALSEGSLPLVELRRATGSPAQTTLRAHLRALGRAGVLDRHRQRDFPGPVDLNLSAAGTDLQRVAAVLQGWLDQCPEGPIRLGGPAAKSVVKPLGEGWSSGLIRALAVRPLALTQLSSLINGISYPSLERRLSAMRRAGLLARRSGQNGKTPYAVTDWLRRAAGPITAAIQWERRHRPAKTTPVKSVDVESIFLLGLPVLELPENLTGSCRLAVELQGSNGELRLAGVVLQIKEGRLTHCVTKLQSEAGAWASGSAFAWLQGLTGGATDALELGGDGSLALSIVEALQCTFAGPPSGFNQTANARPAG